MLDPALLRDRFDAVRDPLQTRGTNLEAELQSLAALEAERRRLLPEVEGLKREQNAAADEVAKAKKQGLDTAALQEANRARAQRIKQLDASLAEIEQRRSQGLLLLPNLPHATVPVGTSADDNVEVRRHGTPRDLGLHAAGALGPGSGARHHRLRARHEYRGRALLRADRRRARSWRAR